MRYGGPKREGILRAALVVFVFAGNLGLASARQASVAQLQRIVDASRYKKDAEAAQQLSGLTLTERLSTARFKQLETWLPGEKSRQALLAIADQSAFRSPPPKEIPGKPAPDLAEQRRVMALVVNYVAKTVPKLPDFLATRTTIRFTNSPELQGYAPSIYEPLHLVDASSRQVGYVDGREVGEEAPRGAKNAPAERGLQSWGEFGPILSTVLLDAARSKLAWLRWEQGSAAPLAVFSYTVPKEHSHFEVDYCCIVDLQGLSRVFRELAGYTGEMAVDPETGAIYRLEVVAQLKPGEPVTEAEIVVEYAPVDIGGRAYICPVHGIALSVGQGLAEERLELVPSAPDGPSGSRTRAAVVDTGTEPVVAQQTMLNDLTLAQYRLFGSEARIIASAGSEPADAEQAGSARPDSSLAQDVPAASQYGVSNTPEAGSSSGSAASPAPDTPKAALPAIPEISVTPAVGLPGSPAVSQQPPPPIEANFRTTSRLVGVSAIAFDKKGSPVTDLKPEDFAILDNGVMQKILFLSRPGDAAGSPASSTEGRASAKGAPRVVSNLQGPGLTDASPRFAASEGGVTILLIDAANVAWSDMSYARSEIQRFLKMLPAGEPVGLYVMRRYGFQVLQEPEADHSALAAVLAKWAPSAQDLAQAQGEEEHNRQQMEFVHDVGSLLYVNGNTPEGGAELGSPADRSLRTPGDSPSKDALRVLPFVARHLATIPGHKSLIWISSDNVLANFSDKAQAVEKDDEHLDSLGTAAEEALNDAHSSISVLDVSQLEAAGVPADVRQANVQLVPTANDAVQLAGLPGSERREALEAEEGSKRDTNPGRVTAQMQQDTHPIQGVFRELADATGGRPLRRAGDIARELSSIAADGRAAYLLSFTPDTPPDGAYHHLTVKVTGRSGITLRYRTGYLYEKEPVTIGERFQQAVWQPPDMTGIALTAIPQRDAQGSLLRLNIAGSSLAMAREGDRWTDKLDIFLVERDDANMRAKVSGQIEALHLLPATHEQIMSNGLTIGQRVSSVPEVGVVRAVVVDENSGRVGTITLPPSAFEGNANFGR